MVSSSPQSAPASRPPPPVPVLLKCCGSCSKRSEPLLHCKRCGVIYYCSREHQAAHFPTRRNACGRISRAIRKVASEDAKIRNRPCDGFMMPERPFETSIGIFWGITDTRGYMGARWEMFTELKHVKTRAAVQARLDHAMDMLRLCRRDNLGVRNLVPALMLRLDKDQECYDFVKWWAKISADNHYDWGDTKLPCLDIKGADAHESALEISEGCNHNLSMKVAIVLLKIKILLDLQRLQELEASRGRSKNPRLPREIFVNVKSHVPYSHIISDDKKLLHLTDHKPMFLDILKQICILYQSVLRHNRYLWPLLLGNAESGFKKRPESLSSGSPDEAVLAVKYTYDAWLETPWALDCMRNFMHHSERHPTPEHASEPE